MATCSMFNLTSDDPLESVYDGDSVSYFEKKIGRYCLLE